MTLHLRVALLLLGSGFSALIYQTAWQRSFRTVFGATTGATAAVLGVFMTGLGLGGWWLGQRAERKTRPLAYYAQLEFGVCLVAAISPWSTQLLGRVYLALGGQPQLGLWGATLARMLVALLVMGPAAWFMGGTLPAAARAAETDSDPGRLHVALLYSLNTAGAVLGSLAGTFCLFELLGTRLSLWFASLVNLLVVVVARAWARELPEVAISSCESVDSPLESASARWERQAIYAAAAVVGLVFLGSELVWYRMASPLLGGSTYSFGLILAVALAGIGIGGWWYSRNTEPRVDWNLLALTILGEAFWLSLPLWLGDSIAIFAVQVRGLAAMGFGALVLAWTLVCLVIVFPAALIAGYQFPLLIAMLGRGRNQVAIHVGRAYLFNAAGSVVGSLLVGFVLLPRIGAVPTWRCLTVALLVVATLAFYRSWRRHELKFSPALFLAALLGACCVGSLNALGPTAIWRHSPIGAGRVKLTSYGRNQFKFWQCDQRNKVIWERDGIDVSVALVAEDSANFVVAGKSDGSVHTDRGTQSMSGLMAALLHPNPKRGFVLGLGTGMSAGWLAQALEHVDVVELEPAIVEVARSVGAANANVLGAKNVSLFLGDGREFLRTTRGRYDVMVSEPSNPYRAGVASLFTVDFYRTVRERLAPHGIFVQWLQGYEIDSSVVLLTLRSLREVFPAVEIWQSQDSDIVFLCGIESRVYDIQAIRDRAGRAPYLDVMRRTWLQGGAEALFSHAFGNMKFVDTLLARNDPPINTDDDNLLEFAVARTVGRTGSHAAIVLFNLALASDADRMSIGNGQLNQDEVRLVRYRNFIITGTPIPSAMSHLRHARAALFESGCIGDGHSPVIEDGDFPMARDLVEAYAYGRVLALKGSDQALLFAQRLQDEGYLAESAYVRGLFEQASRHPEVALSHYEQAIVLLRQEALPLCELGKHMIATARDLAMGNHEWGTRIARTLLERPFVGYLVDRDRIAAAQTLAFASPDPGVCVHALGREMSAPNWTLPFLSARFACLEKARHPMAEVARRQLSEYLSNTIGNYGFEAASPKPLGQAIVPNVYH